MTGIVLTHPLTVHTIQEYQKRPVYGNLSKDDRTEERDIYLFILMIDKKKWSRAR